MRGLSRKLYLDLSVPTEEDQRSDQQRILEALSAEGVKEEVHIPVRMLRQLYPLLDRAGWKITVSLSWNGEKWELVDIESGDTARQHYGLAVDRSDYYPTFFLPSFETYFLYEILRK